MDYEKTLETVKQMVEDGQVSQETAELYFPELKESEDQRIRKAIHIYLDWLDGRKDYAPQGEYSIKDMIAWLKKQDKQKSAETVNWSPQEESNLNKKPQRIVSAEAKEAMYDKPWSEEDENHIIGISQTIFGAIRHNVIGHKTGDMQIDWLRSLKGRIKGE